MARRGRFNPRQPRDKNGRWTSRGGSSGSRSKPRKVVTAKEYRARALGNAVGAVGSFATGQPIIGSLYTANLATNAYRLGSKTVAQRVAMSKKLTASQKRTFTTRKKKVDAIVGKTEKGLEIAITGAYIGTVLKHGAAAWIAGNQASGGTRIARRAITSGGAGLKSAKARRGVYKISSL